MNARAVITIGIVILMSAVGGAAANADEPGFVLPVGFSSHVRPVNHGRINWAEGFILAEGEGKGSGHKRPDQDRLMAKRAAETVAARNAILIADGIPVDADGRFKNIRQGEVRVGGRIRGHKTVSCVWVPNANPPECVATVKVPLWGIQGVAAVVHTAEITRVRRLQQRHLVLVGGDADVSDEVLVIDTRGTGAEPCLYPVILDLNGGVLYDISRFVGHDKPTAPPLRYVETSMTYKTLQARLSDDHDDARSARWADNAQLGFFGMPRSAPAWRCPNPAEPIAVLSAGGLVNMSFVDNAPPTPTTRVTSKPATSQPTTQLEDKSNRRRRRRAVRAVKATGNSKTEIVLTREDAERLRNDPRGANLLKKGQVYVVMDAAAAGIQGRFDRSPGEPVLALLGPR